MTNSLIPPGSTIGIIGGGQLGRMLSMAALSMGYQTHIFSPEAICPAAEAATRMTVAPYDDKAALEKMAKAVDVITFEFENIPHASIETLEQHTPVYPGWNTLYTTQNRLREKEFIQNQNIKTAPYLPVSKEEDIIHALHELGSPILLKTTEQGYDGKGQYKIHTEEEAKELAPSLQFSTEGDFIPFVAEGMVPFTKELSVIIARNIAGEVMPFPIAENDHQGGILHTSIAPAPVSEKIAKEAAKIGRTLAEAFNLVGSLAVELFLTQENELLVNEMAPRPHNSGHWTMDGCRTSQFEQLIRAVTGLPFGSVTTYGTTTMTNIIGEDCHDWQDYIKDSSSTLHLYGKKDVRKGRKMGHCNHVAL